MEAHEIFVFGDQPLLAQFSSCNPAGLSGNLSAMSSVGTSLPPAQFNLTLLFGSEELVPIERLFKAFAPENLSIDPNKAMLPLRFPMNVPMEN